MVPVTPGPGVVVLSAADDASVFAGLQSRPETIDEGVAATQV